MQITNATDEEFILEFEFHVLIYTLKELFLIYRLSSDHNLSVSFFNQDQFGIQI